MPVNRSTSMPQGETASPGPARPLSASTAEGPVCPQCGHELSMYEELRDNRGDRVASVIADAMGSWPFLLTLTAVAASFTTLVVAWSAMRDDAPVLLNYLGITLTTLVAVQTPLILLTQRRDAARDRARDREALRVATQAERDLHAILDQLVEGRRGSTGAGRQDRATS